MLIIFAIFIRSVGFDIKYWQSRFSSPPAITSVYALFSFRNDATKQRNVRLYVTYELKSRDTLERTKKDEVLRKHRYEHEKVKKISREKKEREREKEKRDENSGQRNVFQH